MYTFNSPQDFYSQRDDRTDQCVNVDDYQKVKGLVIAGKGAANSYSGQVMVITALNLLSPISLSKTNPPMLR